MIMFITSIVFAAFRLVAVPFSVIGFFALQKQADPMAVTAIFEIITGAGIAIFGLLANGLMLARIKAGIALGWVLVASVVGSMLVGFWQAPYLAANLAQQNPAAGDAGAIGVYVGVGVVSLFRFALLAAYVVALVMYSKWYAKSR
jgi:hypothetical protein